MMQPRIEYARAAPGAVKAMLDLEKYVRQSGLEASLLELVRLRASQINGCAYCLDMHTQDARAGGETEQRLYTLSAWGAKHRSFPSASAQRSNGPRRSQRLERIMFPTRSSRGPANTSARVNLPI